MLGLASIVPINANPDAVTARIRVGDNPWGVTVDTKTNRVYVANEESNTVSVIDGLTNSVIANVTGLTSPYHLDVNPTTNRVYVTSSQSNFVSVIDGSTNDITARIDLGAPVSVVCRTDLPCPSIAVNPSTNRIYVADPIKNLIYVIDGETDTIASEIKVDGGPASISIDTNVNRMYVANSFANTVSVIDSSSNTVIASVTRNRSPTATSVNTNTHRIYFSEVGRVFVIDGFNNNVVGTIAVSGGYLNGISVNPNTNRVYVADYFSDFVSLIDGSTDMVVGNANVGANPREISVNPNTNKIYVTIGGSGTLAVIDGSVPIPEFADGSLILVLLASIIAAVLVIDRKYRNSSLR